MLHSLRASFLIGASVLGLFGASCVAGCPTGNIVGQCVSEGGFAQFTQVQIFDQATSKFVDEVGTSDDGLFEFNDLSPGAYIVHAFNFGDLSGGTGVAVELAGCETQALEITVAGSGCGPGDLVVHTVSEAEGLPTPAAIELFNDDTGEFIFAASTDAVGTFEFDHLTPTVYDMVVTNEKDGITAIYVLKVAPCDVTDFRATVRTY
jgi:hypothetical protein